MVAAGQILAKLQMSANTEAVEGMARFGIKARHVLGISIPTLRKMAKEIGGNHALALEWAEDINKMDFGAARGVS